MATNVRSSESGSATAGIRVSAARPRKTKITIDDQDEGDDQRELHVVHGVHDGLRAVVHRA